MISLLITILVIVAIVWAAFWIIDSTGIPYPINMIGKVIVGLIGLVALLDNTGLMHGRL